MELIMTGELGESGMEEVLERLRARPCRVRTLRLNWSSLFAADVHRLANAMETNETVENVDLSHNLIGDEGAQILAARLGPAVRCLKLSDNEITDDGAALLLERCASLASPVTELNLEFNPISSAMKQRVQRIQHAKAEKLQCGGDEENIPMGKRSKRYIRLVGVVQELEAENKRLRRELGKLKEARARAHSAKRAADRRATRAAEQLEEAARDVQRAEGETRKAELVVAALKQQQEELVMQLNEMADGQGIERPPVVVPQSPVPPPEHMISFSCKICQEKSISCAFVPCGHLAACMACGKDLRNCPICRSLNTNVLRCFTT